MPEIKFYKSKWKAIRLILLPIPFVIAGIYLLLKSDANKGISWLCICFFGMGIPLGIFNLLDKRPQIIINETGIFAKAAYGDIINWGLITEACIKKIYRRKFICLVLHQGAIPLLKIKATTMQFSKDLGLQELNIPIDQIRKKDAQALTRFLNVMSKADPQERKNLLKEANFINI